MDIEKLQTVYGMTVEQLKIDLESSSYFFKSTIDKLSIFRESIFVIFSNEIGFVTALFIENPACSVVPDNIFKESTHIYVLNNFELDEEKSKGLFQKLAITDLNKSFEIPVEDPYKHLY